MNLRLRNNSLKYIHKFCTFATRLHQMCSIFHFQHFLALWPFSKEAGTGFDFFGFSFEICLALHLIILYTFPDYYCSSKPQLFFYFNFFSYICLYFYIFVFHDYSQEPNFSGFPESRLSKVERAASSPHSNWRGHSLHTWCQHPHQKLSPPY